MYYTKLILLDILKILNLKTISLLLQLAAENPS